MSGNRGRREAEIFGSSRGGRPASGVSNFPTPNKSTREGNYQPSQRLQELVHTPPRDISPSAQPRAGSPALEAGASNSQLRNQPFRFTEDVFAFQEISPEPIPDETNFPTQGNGPTAQRRHNLQTPSSFVSDIRHRGARFSRAPEEQEDLDQDLQQQVLTEELLDRIAMLESELDGVRRAEHYHDRQRPRPSSSRRNDRFSNHAEEPDYVQHGPRDVKQGIIKQYKVPEGTSFPLEFSPDNKKLRPSEAKHRNNCVVIERKMRLALPAAAQIARCANVFSVAKAHFSHFQVYGQSISLTQIGRAHV